MKVRLIVTDTTDADEVLPADASRVTTAERARRYRARRRDGKFVATVEIDEEMLVMLAAGTSSDVEVLPGDRAQINKAVRRALRHLAKFYAETGRIPTR
jgi:hypothetical protein